MARGIDVDHVSVVVIRDLPLNPETEQRDCETYLHRIVRAGRFGKSGQAINMVDPSTRSMIDVLEKHFRRGHQETGCFRGEQN